jgi:putative FmdB family regulatory protein
MPIYEYRCPNGHTFELFQRFADAPIEVCQECGAGPVEKILFPVAVHFKGSGFYATDYGRAGRKSGKDGESDSSESGSSSGDSGGKAEKAASGDKSSADSTGSNDKGSGDKGSGDKGSGSDKKSGSD